MVSFRPGQAGSSEEEQMDLLSGTVSFLVAKGNATNDEARSFFFFVFFFLLAVRKCEICQVS